MNSNYTVYLRYLCVNNLHKGDDDDDDDTVFASIYYFGGVARTVHRNVDYSVGLLLQLDHSDRGFEPNWAMYMRFFCFVLHSADRGLVTGRSPIERILPSLYKRKHKHDS